MRLLTDYNTLTYTGAAEDSFSDMGTCHRPVCQACLLCPLRHKECGYSDLVGKGIQMIFLLALLHLNPHKRWLCMGAG